MNTITINWKTYTWHWSIVVNWDNVMIWWQKIITDEKEINITINWNIEDFNCSYAKTINITWNIWKCKTTSWDIKVKWNILWDAQSTSWDVEAETIWWDVNTTSWDVRAKEIKWKCNTISWDIN